MVMVFIQPISWFSQEFLWEVENVLANMFDGVSFLISSDIILPPLTAFDWHRHQYYSPLILKYVFDKTRNMLLYRRNYVICLGEIDAYSNNLNFVFGEAVPSLNIACVYTKRLNPIYYGEPRAENPYRLYVLRVIKEIIHEWGHLLGLPHCKDRKCVMSFSNSILDVDEKTPFFCDKCRKKILERYNIIQRRILIL